MTQKIFSDHVFNFLKKSFPEFLPTVIYKSDDSFDCELKNPTGQFSVWIATYNIEITFGLKSPTGATDIHTHVSCYDEDDIEYCLYTLAGEIHEIQNNQVVIYKTNIDTWDWIDLKSLKEEENKKGLIFEKIFWNDNGLPKYNPHATNQ